MWSATSPQDDARTLGPVSPDGDRQAQLQALKLRALVRDHLGHDPERAPVMAGPLVGLVHEDEAWVLVHQRAERGLGPALLWAARQGSTRTHVLTESHSGDLARRARLVDPDVDVWFVEGRALLPASPTPRPDQTPIPLAHEAHRATIVAGGAEPVVEHGVLSGEVAGLEVCVVVERAQPDGTTLAVLEVGVGEHDREAFALVHTRLSPAEAVAHAVAAVAPHRAPGAAPHPYNRLAAQRLLRHRVVTRPELVGAQRLEAAPPPVVRDGVRDQSPCCALGVDKRGAPVVVVCSTGVDPDLAPFAADARDALDAAASLVLAVPARDAAAVEALTRGLLGGGARVVGVGLDSGA